MKEPVHSEIDSIHVPAHPATFALAIIFRFALVGLAGWICMQVFWPFAPAELLDARWFLAALALVTYLPSLVRLVVPGSLRKRLEGNYGWVRGFCALAALGLLPFLLSAEAGTLTTAARLLAGAVLADWLVVGRNQERLHRGIPVLWLLMALPWLGAQIWSAHAGGFAYALFDPSGTYFGLIIIGLILGLLGAGTVLVAAGRLKAMITGTSETVSARGSFTPLQW
ncbi:MAG: hypothetical protein Q4P33_08580 [Flaviflexus sp.]|nr:hypothetical protein [Flaviflexus sp.]